MRQPNLRGQIVRLSFATNPPATWLSSATLALIAVGGKYLVAVGLGGSCAVGDAADDCSVKDAYIRIRGYTRTLGNFQIQERRERWRRGW